MQAMRLELATPEQSCLWQPERHEKSRKAFKSNPFKTLDLDLLHFGVGRCMAMSVRRATK